MLPPNAPAAYLKVTESLASISLWGFFPSPWGSISFIVLSPSVTVASSSSSSEFSKTTRCLFQASHCFFREDGISDGLQVWYVASSRCVYHLCISVLGTWGFPQKLSTLWTDKTTKVHDPHDAYFCVGFPWLKCGFSSALSDLTSWPDGRSVE